MVIGEANTGDEISLGNYYTPITIIIIIIPIINTD